MVQIKDSVLRDSGSCPAFPRIATRRASPRCRVAGPVWWLGPMVTVREGCPHRVFDTGQRRRLSTTCQQLVKSAFGCPVSGPGRMSAPRFWMPDDDSNCQQLVNNLSRVLYVVDFRMVFRPSKKVWKFWENGLIFQKVMHGVPKHRNDTAFMLKTRWKSHRGFSRGNPFAPVICGPLCRFVRTVSGRLLQGPPWALSTSSEKTT